jgi:hypothetical protein
MVIYKITNNINGKVYIGQTVTTVQNRWRQHITQSSRKNRSALHSAIEKYGKENFALESIDSAISIEELNFKEEFWITQLNSVVPNGYNLRPGGNNKRHHIETKRKLSLNRPFVVHKKDGQFIGEWDSELQCAQDLAISKSHIGCCLKNIRIITGGYIFCFKDEIHTLSEKLTLANKRFRSRPKFSLTEKRKMARKRFEKRIAARETQS